MSDDLRERLIQASPPEARDRIRIAFNKLGPGNSSGVLECVFVILDAYGNYYAKIPSQLVQAKEDHLKMLDAKSKELETTLQRTITDERLKLEKLSEKDVLFTASVHVLCGLLMGFAIWHLIFIITSTYK